MGLLQMKKKKFNKKRDKRPSSLPIRKKYHNRFTFKGTSLPLERNLLASEELLLISKQHGYLSFEQLEAARKSIKKVIAKSSKLISVVYPFFGVTKKPLQSRMGKGKGSKVKNWIYPVRPGQTIFRLQSRRINSSKLIKFFSAGCSKLPIYTKVVASFKM